MRNPNGYGTVTKLSGKRRKPWIVKVTVGYDNNSGQQIQKSLGTFINRQEALKCLALYNVSKENGTLNNHFEKSKTQMSHTFLECVEAVIEQRKDRKSQQWFNSRKSAIKLLSDIDTINIETLNLNEIQLIFDKLRIYGKSSSTMVLCKTICKEAFNYAIMQKWINRDDDYTSYIDTTSLADRKTVHQPFSKEEIVKIANDDCLISKVIIVYILTGCRASELLKVRKCEGYIICGMKTKSGKNRKIPIHSHIETYIDEVLEYLSGVTYFELNGAFKRYLKTKNIVHTLHDTRNTFATLGNEFDMKHSSIKKIMGHKSNDITYDVYTHETIDYLKEEIEKIKI